MTHHLLPVKTKLNPAIAEMLVLGGAVLGRGGGGRFEAGLRMGQLALELGDAFLVDLPDCGPEARLIGLATCRSLTADLDAPRPRSYSRAVELLTTNTGITVTSLVNCGSGAVETLKGWVQSALLGVPLVDAAFDALLHPLPIFDTLLRWPDDDPPLAMAVVGQSIQHKNGFEIFTQGAPSTLMTLLQQVTGALDGQFAVAIGPLPARWVQEQGCAGFISRTLEIGRMVKQNLGGDGGMTANLLQQHLRGQCQISGTVTCVQTAVIDRRAYKIIHLKNSENRSLKLVWRHRYLLLLEEGHQIVAFPDLIVTLGSRGTPLSGEEPGEGQDIHLVIAAEPIAPSCFFQESIYPDLEILAHNPDVHIVDGIDCLNGRKGG